MKYLFFIFLSIFIVSCSKEKIPIAEKYSDNYTVKWVEFNYDSIKGLGKNYQLIELFIPKDKSKDTFYNQSKLYVDGNLNKKNSQYYNIDVKATDKKHTYLAKIKLYSEYSNLPIRGRYADFFFLNFYEDSTSIGSKNFENTDEFEIEFINFHNDRFEAVVTEFFLRDTLIENIKDQVNMRTIETVLCNKKNMSGIFVKNDSLTNQRKFSLKDYRNKN